MTAGEPELRRPWARLAIAAVAVALVAGLLLQLASEQVALSPEALREAVAAAGVLAPLAFIVLHAAAILVVVLPSTLFIVAASILFPFWLAVPVAIAGSTLGGTSAFVLSRYGGRQRVERLLARQFEALDESVSRGGFVVVLALRLIAIPPFALTSYLLGLTGIRAREFVAGTALGILPYTVLFTYLGAAVLEARGNPAALLRPDFLLLTGAAVAAGIALLAALYLRFRRPAPERPATILPPARDPPA